MEFLPVTSTLAFLLAVAAFIGGPVRGLPYLFISLPFGAGAALNLPALGDASILIANVTAAAYLAGVLLRPPCWPQLRQTVRLGSTGFWLLMLAYIGLGITLLCPELFAGKTYVFSITRGPEAETIGFEPLSRSTGNLTQGLYFLQSILLFIAVRATLKQEDAGLIRQCVLIASLVHIGLAILDIVSYTSGQGWIMELIQTANYTILTESSLGGLKRIVGGFSEASTCSGFTVGLLGFWLGYWKALGRATPVLIFSGLLIMLLLSTASSAYASFMLFSAILILDLAIRAVLRKLNPRERIFIGAGSVLLGSVVLIGLLASIVSSDFYNFLDRVAISKLSSASGLERSAWNTSAWTNFTETFYLGAGLGSVRGSSLLFSLLGTLGVAGFFLYLIFGYCLLRDYMAEEHRSNASESDAIRSGALFGCLALLMNYMLINSSPDLGLTFMLFAAALRYESKAVETEDYSSKSEQYESWPAPRNEQHRAVCS